ncbi:MAG: preprotein translocase subunit YajC [Oscillospiraceae bacterium]|nr:preprotein translocase subunit YajC [Oscillospiraceae bacterium]
MNGISGVLPFIVIIIIIYLFLIRPESKKKKTAQQMRSNLEKGDKIVTVGGIIGVIVQVTEETLVIETSADRVRVEVMKWAVSSKKQDKPEKIEEPEPEDEE